MSRPLLLLLVLLLPSSVFALPVRLDVFNGSSGGMGFSSVHETTGCELNGYWRCGPSTPIAATAGTGFGLTANFDGVSRFDQITGSLSIGGVSHVVSGALDFGVAAGQQIGELTVQGFGTFLFVNDRHGTAIANTWNPTAPRTGDLYLWGQTFAPTAPGAKPPAGWGIDLGMSARPIPEPSAALVFGLGALLVGANRRRGRI